HRSIGSAGGIHGEVRIGDSTLMIGGGGPGLAWKGQSAITALRLCVPDTDTAYQRALESSATSIGAPAGQRWRERGARVRDAEGMHCISPRPGARTTCLQV